MTTKMFAKLVYLEHGDYDRLVRYTNDIRARSPGVQFSVNDAIRVLIHHGLDEVEAQRPAEEKKGGGA